MGVYGSTTKSIAIQASVFHPVTGFCSVSAYVSRTLVPGAICLAHQHRQAVYARLELHD